MAPTNNFLPFCPNDTGTNLLTQGDYAAATDRDVGNQPGVASSKLNNKALRQSAYIASQIAQFIADQSLTDVLDNATPATLLAQIHSVLDQVPSEVQKFTTPGAGNYNSSFVFYISSGNATAGATYTNNAVTYTVVRTVASSLKVVMRGSGSPTHSGALTKTGGTGDSTLTFLAVRAPKQLHLKLVGGGGGGAGSGTGINAGSDGGDTVFGDCTMGGGKGGGGASFTTGGLGGAPTAGSLRGITVPGGTGGGAFSEGITTVVFPGLNGAASALGGEGGGVYNGIGLGAATNTGAGGAGGGVNFANGITGAAGGSGAWGDGIYPWSATISLSVGALGIAGSAGANGSNGGPGSDGQIVVIEQF